MRLLIERSVKNGKVYSKLFLVDSQGYKSAFSFLNEEGYINEYAPFEWFTPYLGYEEIKKAFGKLEVVACDADRESIKKETKKIIEWWKTGIERIKKLEEEKRVKNWLWEKLVIDEEGKIVEKERMKE